MNTIKKTPPFSFLTTFIALISIFLGTVFLGCSNETPATKIEPTKTYSIGLTQENFKDKFYTSAKKLDMDIKISSYRMGEKEGYGTISAEISPKTGFRATVNKSDNTIRTLTLLSAPDGTSNSAIETLSCMAILIDMVSPGMMPEDRGKILKDLGFDENIADKSHTQTIRGDIVYTLDFVRGTGVQFAANNKDDK